MELTRPRVVGLLVAAAAVLLGGLVILAYSIGSQPSPSPTPTASPSASPSLSPTPTPTPTPTPVPSPSPSPTPSASPEARCPYDGEPLATEPLAEPVLISIDNHPAARPASNLNAADIVFENPVQGNSTRFVALFACDGDVGRIGPVRSGRWIQRDLWQQFRMLPIIYGAAPYTTSYYRERAMPYVDGNVEPWDFFSRSASRRAPYNVYLDMERLQQLIADHPAMAQRADDAGEPRPVLRFDSDWTPPDEARPVDAIGMSTTSTWSFGWEYNTDRGLYERIDARRSTLDAIDDSPLSRRSLIVQFAVSERPFADPRPEADPPIQRLTGSGDGIVYVDGVAFDVQWSRPSEDDVTTWTVASTGDDLILPPGPVWWHVLPTTVRVQEK